MRNMMLSFMTLSRDSISMSLGGTLSVSAEQTCSR